jgi:hypothetical protein
MPRFRSRQHVKAGCCRQYRIRRVRLELPSRPEVYEDVLLSVRSVRKIRTWLHGYTVHPLPFFTVFIHEPFLKLGHEYNMFSASVILFR